MSDDDFFFTEFLACRWPFEKWHHRDHVKLAYLFLRRYSYAEAMSQIGPAIRAHNAAHHRPESLTRGYHETLTQVWLRLVHFTLCQFGPAASADEFFDQHPELWQWQIVRLYYSTERLWSREAKAEFVEPDLAPLPPH